MLRAQTLLLTTLAVACGPASIVDIDAGHLPPSGHVDAGRDDRGIRDAGHLPHDGGTHERVVEHLEVTPKSLELTVGGVSGLTATARFNDGTWADVSGSAQWEVTAEGIVELEVLSMGEDLVRLSGIQAGHAQVTARAGDIVSEPVDVTVSEAPMKNYEVRAIWVTRFAYSNQDDVVSVINRAADAGFNVIYFQIRGAGDAYYRSSLVPWAARLSSPQTLGRDPGWDPLQVAIDTARARGLQLHAYWNVYSAWTTPSGCANAGTCTCRPQQGRSDSCTLPPASPPGVPTHALRANPDWMAVNAQGRTTDTEYYWFSPGNPAVKAHLLAVAAELLDNYDIDGLHLDRVRYAGPQYSRDAASLSAYGALPGPQRPAWEDWQREQVNALVGDLYDLVKQKRPNAVLSASVWGIYRQLPGCGTSQGFANYYQDSIAWTKRGLIDALVPMIYWDLGTGCTDWATHLDVFLAGSNGRPIIAGMHALDMNSFQTPRIQARVEHGRSVGAAGHAIFASTHFSQHGTWDALDVPGGPYEHPAEPPPITWRSQ